MDVANKTILVVGATGQQGGAAARHLLADGWKLRALAYHPDSPAAQALAAQGVELVPGDLLDRPSLDRAVEGVYGVYSMQSPASAGADGEIAEGMNMAEAAAAAGVQHFVYSSVEGAQAEDGPSWVQPKHRIETHIAELRLPATIWRPVSFMENYLRHESEIQNGKLSGPAWPESDQYLIAVNDIGRFVALAFSDPERFIGTAMAIAGDKLTVAEVAATFARALNHPVMFVHAEMPGMPPIPQPTPGEAQHVRADLKACRELLPDLMRLEDWIRATGWRPVVS